VNCWLHAPGHDAAFTKRALSNAQEASARSCGGHGGQRPYSAPTTVADEHPRPPDCKSRRLIFARECPPTSPSLLTARRLRACSEGRGPIRSGPECSLLLGTPYELRMMEVSIHDPVWRRPCSHPMSPKCSCCTDCPLYRQAGQGAGPVTG